MFQNLQLWRRAGEHGRALSRRERRKAQRRRQLHVRLCVERLEQRWLLASILVTTELDIVAADTKTSLREAVLQANNQTTNPGHDTITFASSLANKPVVLSSVNGQIIINDTLNIQGLGAGRTTVDGLNGSRLFDITNTAGDVTFDGLTLTGGKTTANGEKGGAIRSLSASLLTIQNSTVSGNSTAGFDSDGGGIFAAGSVTVTNSTISGNRTNGKDSDGGGIFSNGGMTVTNSTISGNSTTGQFSDGGGIYGFNSVTVTNSTITGNSVASADGGGAVSLNGQMTIINSIVAGNQDTGNGSHPDMRQFIGSPTIQFSMIGGDPMLGPLVENGGATKTHRPRVGSPVIDAGNNGLAIDPGPPQMALTTDQRGAPFARIVDGPDAGTTATVDMGAVELALVPFPLVVTTANDELDATPNAADLSLREAIALANGGLGADTITFAAALAGQPILLTLGQMTISDPLTIRGLGAGQTTVMGSNDPQLYSRLFDITDTAGAVTFDGLNLTGGKSTARGGAISSTSASQLTIQNSTISGNSTGVFGRGGGVYAFGSVTVTNSTISGNSTTASFADGGGIFSLGSVTISNCTITGNSVAGTNADGGGVFSLSGVTIRNSIVAGNLDKQDGTHPELGSLGSKTVEFSLIGDNNGNLGLTNGTNGNLVGTHALPLDPQLGPLQNNGGSTPTHALIATSPAIDAGDTGFVAPPSNDQRGAPFVRVADGPDANATARVDMGAFEFQTVIGSTLIVNAAIDESDGNYTAGDMSLRDALALANASSGPHTITFAAALAGQPTLLTLGQMTISDVVTIQGLGAAQTTVRGSNNPLLFSRLFDITSTAGAVTFDGLTLTGGKTTANNQGGGAIRSSSVGQLTIQNSTISGNSTLGGSAPGGGVFARSLTVANSTISGNSTIGSFAGGGGINASSSLTVANSTISGNSTAQSGGGGIYTIGMATITNSTISGNSTTGNGAHGGGIYVRGSIFGNGSLTVASSTTSGNSVAAQANGGGVYGASYFSYGGSFTTAVTIRNSIVAGNRDIQGGSHPDVRPGGVPLTVEYSLIGDNSGTGLAEANPGPGANGNKIGNAASVMGVLIPRLAQLAFNGGPTKTHALCTGAGVPVASCTVASPALNSGDPGFSPPPNTDQRGAPFVRVAGGRIDMGAFEEQGSFTVNSIADTGDASVGNGICDAGGGVCTLRAALQEANALAGVQLIKFNILGTGPHTITPLSALPAITQAVIIDGTTEPNFVAGGPPVVQLVGTSAGALVNGLKITAGGSTVRGLAINRFLGNGIELRTGGGNVVQGNYIGTNVAGTADQGNARAGVLIVNSAGNTIGGTTTAKRNVISGNNRYGVEIVNSPSTGNLVQGNYIGTGVNGTSAMGNTLAGVQVTDASSNSIGGTAAGAGNTIAFNRQNGVQVTGLGTGNLILRNALFTNVGLGIDLNGDGVTVNDANDPDTGPNKLQNFPVMTSVVLSGTNLKITYSVPSIAPHSTFPLRVEFFIADTANQEGKTFLGSNTYTTPGSKLATIPAGSAVLGTKIIATATDNNGTGSTSEFSANRTVASSLLEAEGVDPATANEPTPLTSAQLAPIVDAAIMQLVDQGFSAAQAWQLSSVSFAIADRPPATLGLAPPHVMTLDATAADYGWFVDPTPDDDEFNTFMFHKDLEDSQTC